MNSPVDPALLQLVHQELKSLHDVLDNMSVESVEEKTKVRCELGSISAGPGRGEATSSEIRDRAEKTWRTVLS